MKVVHYINNLGAGGAEKLLSDILPLMQQKGVEVTLAISTSKLNVSKFERILKENQVKIIDFNVSRYNPFQIIKLVRYIKENNVDVVHAHLFPTQYWLSIASLFLSSKVKIIKTEHAVYNSRRKWKLFLPIERFVYRRFQVVIGITEEVKRSLVAWLGKNVVESVIINNGVNLNQIQSEQNDIDISDYDFIDRDSINILMVASFDGSQKDQKTLLKSLKLLPHEFKVYFVGEGSYRIEIEKFCQKAGLSDRVTFLGLRQDVYKLMYLVDINVLSTNYEGMSGVVLESLASTNPFLGSDVAGVKEIVPDKRFLFAKGDEKELAEKILHIAHDEQCRLDLVSAALSHVRKFDIKKMVDSHLELYYSLD